ncbi:MAG: aromatic ring-hydroxylating dioxygenase subunit alpha, partial [Pseudomonadales bacterium]|nr:aromatic ring-hydroxylating dioxygenase subunit alpha [Pseudomonadales bacterium]
LEKELIFKRGWILIGRQDQVANPGDYMALRVCDENIVLTRDTRDVIHVLSNVCTHRWMPVCEGTGNRKFFTCPYHAWAFELNGTLRGAPGMQDAPGYDPEKLKLPSIRHEIWKGFIFINIEGSAESLLPQLSPLDKELAEYHLEDWKVVRSKEWGKSPWNWKTFQDNGDCYHHIGTHPETLEREFPGSLSYSLPNNGAYTMVWSPTREKFIVEDEAGKRMSSELPLMPGLTERQRTAFCLIYVLPNYFIFVRPDMAAIARVFPTGPEEIHLHTDIMLPPHLLNLPETDMVADLLLASVDAVHLEDITVCTNVQQGMHSQFAKRSPYSLLETHNRDVMLFVARKLAAVLDDLDILQGR